MEPRTTIESVDPLTDPRWDRWVGRHPLGTVFHTSAWARLLVETYGFLPFYLVEQTEGEWVRGLLLMEVRGLFGARRGVSLPFSDVCPPLIPEPSPTQDATPSALADPAVPASSTSPPGPTVGRRPQPPPQGEHLDPLARRYPLIGAAVRLGRRRGWRSIELRDAAAWTSGLPSSLQFHGHIIDLNGGEESVLARFSPTTRRAIRKAEASNLQVTLAADLKAMRSYHELHCLTRRRHGLPPQPWPFFEVLQRRLLEPGHGFIVTAAVDGRPVASAVFLNQGRGALYKFGASDENFLSLRPNNGVFWAAIRACIARGFTSLDLGRTSLANAGLRRFKLGWGGLERPVGYTQFDLASGRILPVPDRASGWTTVLFRRLPGPVAAWVGARLYRFAA